MKIIDLLNDVLKGNKIPSSVRYENKIYCYDIGEYDYCCELEYLFYSCVTSPTGERMIELLNQEVEIIEEEQDKLMPKHLTNEFIQGLDRYMTKQDIKHIAHKVNEIINYLQHISKKEDE